MIKNKCKLFKIHPAHTYSFWITKNISLYTSIDNSIDILLHLKSGIFNQKKYTYTTRNIDTFYSYISFK